MISIEGKEFFTLTEQQPPIRKLVSRYILKDDALHYMWADEICEDGNWHLEDAKDTDIWSYYDPYAEDLANRMLNAITYLKV